MPAFVAMGAGKTVRENSAFEIAAKGTFHMGRRRFIEFPGREFQPGFEVRLHGAIPQRLFGTAALLALCAERGTFDCGNHRAIPFRS